MFDVEEIYVKVETLIQDMMEEKKDIIGTYLSIICNLFYNFNKSPYIKSCILFVNNAINKYLEEVDLEQTIYENILAFFDNMESIDEYNNMSQLKNINEILSYFEHIYEQRTLSFAKFSVHLEKIAYNDDLSKDNFYCQTYQSLLTDAKRKYILTLLPK